MNTPSARPVPRRASTRGGPLLLLVLVFVLPGVLVSVPVSLMMLFGDGLPPGQLAKGYLLAALFSAGFGALLGGAVAYRNRRVRPAFEEAAERLGLTVDRPGFMGDIALLGRVDGVDVELAWTLGGEGRKPVLAGTAASPSPGGLKLWAYAPQDRDAPFGAPPPPPFVSPEEGGGWRRWGVDLATVQSIEVEGRHGGSVDEQETRVSAVQLPGPAELDADGVVEAVRVLLQTHAAWEPPDGQAARARASSAGAGGGGGSKKGKSAKRRRGW